ncbi:uncharacterized protein LOC144128029 [Amblyomma americanum]
MAGVFRSSLQTTVEIAVGDITKTVTAVRSSDGSCIPDGNGYLYEGADGERYVLVFEDEHTPASQPRASDESGIGASASAEAVAPIPASAEADLELWSGAKTRFLIDKYVQFKDLVGQKGGFRTKKMFWTRLTNLLNHEFGGTLSAVQVENKWKSLERSYKRARTKNNTSGHHRVPCEYEEELSKVLEKEHHIQPPALLETGASAGNSDVAAEDMNSSRDMEVPASMPRRKRQRTSSNSVLAETLLKLDAARAKRHEERMAKFDMLIEVMRTNKQ